MRTLEKQATPRPSAFPPAFTPVKNAKQPKQPEYDGILTDAQRIIAPQRIRPSARPGGKRHSDWPMLRDSARLNSLSLC